MHSVSAALGQSPLGQAYCQGLQVPPAASLWGHSHRWPGSGRGQWHPVQAGTHHPGKPCHQGAAQPAHWASLAAAPQATQAAPQPAEVSNLPPVSSPVEGQALGTSGASLGLPSPSWSHPRDSALGVSPSSHWAALLSPTGQPSASLHSNPLLAATAPWHHLTGRHPL